MEKIIIELLSRIKALEEDVEKLKKGEYKNTEPKVENYLSTVSMGNFQKENNKSEKQVIEELIFTPEKVGLTESARRYIAKCKNIAKKKGLNEITLLCNDIQKALGVINRTPAICMAMYDMMEAGDEVVSAPPSGKSTTVRVKYLIK